MGIADALRAAKPWLVQRWRWLKNVLSPAILLWPWLAVAAIFFVFLGTSQGQALTWQMSASAWYSWSTVVAVAVAFAATLSACLLTSLVVLSGRGKSLDSPDQISASASQPADGRRLATLHIVWAFVLSSLPILLVAWEASSFVALAVAGLLGAFGFMVLKALVLRGAWDDPSGWSAKLERLRANRLLLAAGVVALASAPLLIGAFMLTGAPESAMNLGPIFVTLLGLSTLSSLFAAVFIALPYCTPFPKLVALIPLAAVVANVVYHPIADAENPLLKELNTSTTAKYESDRRCARVQRSLARALQDQADDAVQDAKRSHGVPAMFFVSAEGGGIRAAYWTAMGLANLEETLPGFGDRIATMSGVSGGSLGIATWLAAVEATDSLDDRRALIHRFLSSDLLSPAIAGLLFLDTPRLFFGPFWFSARRDDVFEATIVNRWRQVAGADADFFTRPLVNLCFKRMKHPPTVYFGATEVLMGAFAPMGNTHFGMPGGDRKFVNGLLRQSDLVRTNVVHSVVMSARFPFLSPTADVAVSLENVHDYLATPQAPLPRWIRVKMNDGKTPEGFPTIPGTARLGMLVDGGYFDNSGLTMTRYALNVLGQHVPEPRPAVVVASEPQKRRTFNAAFEARSQVATHVLHFANDPTAACVDPAGWESTASRSVREAIERAKFQPRCRFEVDELEALFRPRWLSWVSSPVETILAVRAGHAAHELNAMTPQLLTRRYPSALFNYSLAGELTQQLCNGRKTLHTEKCLSAGGQYGPFWKMRPTDELPGLDAMRARAECKNLSQSPPLPLGWALHSDDTALMQCLSSNGALNATVQIAEVEAKYHFVAAGNMVEEAVDAASATDPPRRRRQR